MRCKYCGSTALHVGTQHRNFSAGKAAAGAVTFGVVGAAAGFIGKEVKGYQCGACGAFMDEPMYILTESSISTAISEARSGYRSMYDYFKQQYPNIEDVPVSSSMPVARVETSVPVLPTNVVNSINTPQRTVKRIFANRKWNRDCPVYIKAAVIAAENEEDVLSLVGMNQGRKTIRSVYLTVQVLDDTGDKISEETCVYQNISCVAGAELPTTQTFPLHTALAYHADVTVDKIALEDGSVWRNDENGWVEPESQTELTEANFARFKQLCRETKAWKANQTSNLYMPIKCADYWQCICGMPVNAGSPCPHCGETPEHLDTVMAQEYLETRQHAYIRSIAEKRAKEAQELYANAVSEQQKREEAKREAAKKRELAAKKRELAAKKAEENRKNKLYAEAIAAANEKTETGLSNAVKKLITIKGWKDTDQKIVEFNKEIDRIRETIRVAEETKKKIIDKVMTIVAVMAVIALAAVIVATTIVIPNVKYNRAMTLYNAGDYEGAIVAFSEMNGYKDSKEQIANAEEQINLKAYEAAAALQADGKSE